MRVEGSGFLLGRKSAGSEGRADEGVRRSCGARDARVWGCGLADHLLPASGRGAFVPARSVFVLVVGPAMAMARPPTMPRGPVAAGYRADESAQTADQQGCSDLRPGMVLSVYPDSDRDPKPTSDEGADGGAACVPLARSQGGVGTRIDGRPRPHGPARYLARRLGDDSAAVLSGAACPGTGSIVWSVGAARGGDRNRFRGCLGIFGPFRCPVSGLRLSVGNGGQQRESNGENCFSGLHMRIVKMGWRLRWGVWDGFRSATWEGRGRGARASSVT